jgi:cytochrome c peroxidase
MAEIQLGKTLTKEQTDAIVAFLNTLTGELPAEFAQAK